MKSWRDLANEALERKLADEQLRRLLVAADLAEGDSSGAVAVGFLHTLARTCASEWRGPTCAGCLGGELLAGISYNNKF